MHDWERRAAPRASAPAGATVMFDGRHYALRNWSTNGFLCRPCLAERQVGDEVWVEIIAPDAPTRYRLSAQVVRVEPTEGLLAAKFTRATKGTLEAMAEFLARPADQPLFGGE